MSDFKKEEFYVDDWVIYTGLFGTEYLGKVVAIHKTPNFVTVIIPEVRINQFTTAKEFLKKLNSSELLLFLLEKDS